MSNWFNSWGWLLVVIPGVTFQAWRRFSPPEVVPIVDPRVASLTSQLVATKAQVVELKAKLLAKGQAYIEEPRPALVGQHSSDWWQSNAMGIGLRMMARMRTNSVAAGEWHMSNMPSAQFRATNVNVPFGTWRWELNGAPEPVPEPSKPGRLRLRADSINMPYNAVTPYWTTNGTMNYVGLMEYLNHR